MSIISYTIITLISSNIIFHVVTVTFSPKNAKLYSYLTALNEKHMNLASAPSSVGTPGICKIVHRPENLYTKCTQVETIFTAKARIKSTDHLYSHTL